MRHHQIFGPIVALLLTITACNPKTEHQSGQNNHAFIKNINGVEISIDSLEVFIERGMEDMNMAGLSIAFINRGKVVYHSNNGYSSTKTKLKVDQTTIFEAASISKPVFAYTVMKLVDSGLLDLDRPLSEYLNEDYPGLNLNDDKVKKITARMVLSHTSGFPNWREGFDLKLQFDPGTAFSYSGEGYQYLVGAVMAILKTDYPGLEDFFHKEVAIPLGMPHTKFVQDEYNLKHKAKPHKNGIEIAQGNPDNEFNAAAALHSEASEYAKFIIALLLQKGLSRERFVDLFTEQVKTPDLEWFSEVGITHWTLGFAKHHFDYLPRPIYGHVGNNEGFTSLFLMDLKEQWGMIMFTNTDQSDNFGFDLFKRVNQATK